MFFSQLSMEKENSIMQACKSLQNAAVGLVDEEANTFKISDQQVSP